MQNFIKIYPKVMSVRWVRALVTVELHYTVEQYGVLTGPFTIGVTFHPEILAKGADPWVIISNTRPRYNRLFDHFFSSMERYLSQCHGIRPIEEVVSGQKKSFEMYFPDIHYDYSDRSFETAEANAILPPQPGP